MKLVRWLRGAALLSLCILGGSWLGMNGARRLQAWWTPPPPEVADNAAYFRGETVAVVMFGTATCPWCAKTRELLQRLKVPYREHRIDASPESMALYRTLNAGGVPVVLVGTRRVYGFDEAKLRAAVEGAPGRGQGLY
jgi:glutaredoxin